MNTPWILWFSVLAFMCGILYTILSISSISNIAGNKDMMSAILTIAMVNGALCLTLAGTGYFSVNSITLLKRPYIFIVLHATLIFAMIGFCVATLRQLGIDPTKIKPQDAAASAAATTSSSPPNIMATAIGLGSTGFALGLISIFVLIYLWRKGKFN